MPTYDYRCSACNHQEEVFQKISSLPLSVCPSCKQPSFQRGFGGGIGLQFKGQGFYLTDYKPSTKT